jgi:hypothetical protein
MNLRLLLAIALSFVMVASPALAQDTATKSLTLVVNAGVVAITTTTLPNGMVGLIYTTQNIIASGGVSPYTYSVTSGSLPAGLTLTAAGALSGTPTTAGSSTFTVQVADSEKPAVTATQSYTVVVYPTLSITTATLSAANVGMSYTATITATGGVAPYTFAVTTGSLPAGLTLSSSGTISGTPTAAGSFTFTITVTDSAANVVMLHVEGHIEVASSTHTTIGARS